MPKSLRDFKLCIPKLNLVFTVGMLFFNSFTTAAIQPNPFITAKQQEVYSVYRSVDIHELGDLPAIFEKPEEYKTMRDYFLKLFREGALTLNDLKGELSGFDLMDIFRQEELSLESINRLLATKNQSIEKLNAAANSIKPNATSSVGPFVNKVMEERYESLIGERPEFENERIRTLFRLKLSELYDSLNTVESSSIPFFGEGYNQCILRLESTSEKDYFPVRSIKRLFQLLESIDVKALAKTSDNSEKYETLFAGLISQYEKLAGENPKYDGKTAICTLITGKLNGTEHCKPILNFPKELCK